MSLKNLMLLVVVAISMHSSTSSPTISFEAIGKEKDNVIQALGGLKSQLLSPFAGIAKGLIGAKLGLARFEQIFGRYLSVHSFPPQNRSPTRCWDQESQAERSERNPRQEDRPPRFLKHLPTHHFVKGRDTMTS